MTRQNLAAIRKSCCFTGHRVIPYAELPALKARLEGAVRQLIEEKKILNFIAGGALGFDTLAAECVLSLKKDYPDIRLLLALPCPEQAARWKKEDIARYERILLASDKHIYISPSYTPACMHERNRFLVDHSRYCIAYLQSPAQGGTAYTYAYAEKKGLHCVNLAQ